MREPFRLDKFTTTLRVAVYVMEVLGEQATWLEMRWRERRWCSIEDAGERLRDHPVWALYERFRLTLVR